METSKKRIKMKKKLYEALEAKYMADKKEAVATLEVYSTNPAGIGEHPQVVEEMSKQVEKLANANDCLAEIKRLGK